mmetsp:Transcript_63357/g.149164  ORF Transcript_63357/g.149164 Transcript_63357/m.149164 type:complete len:93 (+) Transcript_63357:219-497(+)
MLCMDVEKLFLVAEQLVVNVLCTVTEMLFLVVNVLFMVTEMLFMVTMRLFMVVNVLFMMTKLQRIVVKAAAHRGQSCCASWSNGAHRDRCVL